MSVVEQTPEIEEVETLNEVEEVLIKAENYIRKHGWTKGNYEYDDGSVCLVGALTYAVYGRLEPESDKGKYIYVADIESCTNKYSKYIYDVIDQLTPPHEVDVIADWNDVVANSVEDVYELLHKARELAHNDGSS